MAKCDRHLRWLQIVFPGNFNVGVYRRERKFVNPTVQIGVDCHARTHWFLATLVFATEQAAGEC